jgi:hypothetical protein
MCKITHINYYPYTSTANKLCARGLVPPEHMHDDIRAVTTFPKSGNKRSKDEIMECFVCESVAGVDAATTLRCCHADYRLVFHVKCVETDLVIRTDKEGKAQIQTTSGLCPACAPEVSWPIESDPQGNGQKRKRKRKCSGSPAGFVLASTAAQSDQTSLAPTQLAPAPTQAAPAPLQAAPAPLRATLVPIRAASPIQLALTPTQLHFLMMPFPGR